MSVYSEPARSFLQGAIRCDISFGQTAVPASGEGCWVGFARQLFLVVDATSRLTRIPYLC